MLYAVCLSYHSSTKVVLFARLSSSWAITMGRLLGPKVGNNIKNCLSQGHNDVLPHRKSNQGFATFWILDRYTINWATLPPKGKISERNSQLRNSWHKVTTREAKNTTWIKFRKKISVPKSQQVTACLGNHKISQSDKC